MDCVCGGELCKISAADSHSGIRLRCRGKEIQVKIQRWNGLGQKVTITKTKRTRSCGRAWVEHAYPPAWVTRVRERGKLA